MATQTNFPIIPLTEVPILESLQIPAPHRPSILVVDDERIIADTLTQIFNRSGYAATACYSAAAALEAAIRVRPDLLITDVVMPVQNGVDLAIMMRSLCPDCRIILFSGQASTVDLLASANGAGYEFELLSKPVHPLAMLEKVAELLPNSSTMQIN